MVRADIKRFRLMLDLGHIFSRSDIKALVDHADNTVSDFQDEPTPVSGNPFASPPCQQCGSTARLVGGAMTSCAQCGRVLAGGPLNVAPRGLPSCVMCNGSGRVTPGWGGPAVISCPICVGPTPVNP